MQDDGHVGTSPKAWIYTYPGYEESSGLQITGIKTKERRKHYKMEKNRLDAVILIYQTMKDGVTEDGLKKCLKLYPKKKLKHKLKRYKYQIH